MVKDEDLARLLKGDGSLEQKAQQLTDAANAAGGRDNISVLLAQASVRSSGFGRISRLLGL
jgi:protein phosphatase